MKNILKQLGKAVCYFLLFLISQNLIATVYQVIYAFKAGVDAAMTGAPLDNMALVEGMVNYTYENMTAIIFISGCFTVLCLWLFFLIRKKNVLKETHITKFAPKYIPVLTVLGIAIQVFFSFGTAFLPEEILIDYMEDYNQKLGTFSVMSVLAQVVAAPVVEEIIFRGLMVSRMKKAMPTWVAVLISSIAFGLVHGQIFWMTYAFLLGILLAAIAIKTDSILTTIILHAAINGAGVIMSLMTFDIPVAAYVVLTIVGGAISVGAAYLLLKKSASENAQAKQLQVE